MPTDAYTTETVTEARKIAENVNNICHAIPDRRNTEGMTDEVVDVLNHIGDRMGSGMDWDSTSDERIRVMVAWCDLLPAMKLVPLHHDPNTTDWHWSTVRCFLAGAGYEAHAALAARLSATYPQCALDPSESREDWMKALVEAHQHSGIPANIAAIPWATLRQLPGVPKDHGMDLTWLVAAALLHMVKHVRIYDGEVRVLYGGSVTYYRYAQDTNDVNSQQRTLYGMLSALHMSRADMRKKEGHLTNYAVSKALHGLTFTRFLQAAPLARLPGAVLAGQFTGMLPDPTSTEGWFQHGLRLTNAWVAGNGRIRPYHGSDDTIMGYGWRIDPLTEDTIAAYAALTDAIPTTYEVDTPFAILCQYQPNFVFDWCKDLDAYACLIDAVLIMSVMRGQVAAARREFPLLWVLPNEPTPEASTNQGKTTAVQALAGCMTPGIFVARPPDTNSAPDMRIIAGLIKQYGTLALDEWAMPKNQAHPLSHRNLQTLATGGALPMGEVLENNPSPVVLRQPIVASAKCLSIPEDIRNRSVFIFQRQLEPEERADIQKYTAITSGEVSVRMRMAALDLVRQHNLDKLRVVASQSLRFSAHFSLAMVLYGLRTGTNDPEKAQRVLDETMTRMTHHFAKHYAAADESGLMSEMESGENLTLRASTIFGTASEAELRAMVDLAKQTADNGRMTAGQLLRIRATAANQSSRVMLAEALGYSPRASDRALCQALGRDLKRIMSKPNDEWALPEFSGVCGWRLKRETDGSNGAVRVKLICTNPASPTFASPHAP